MSFGLGWNTTIFYLGSEISSLTSTGGQGLKVFETEVVTGEGM
jgi:hypothetical protein